MRLSSFAVVCPLLAPVVLAAGVALPAQWREEARLFGEVQGFGWDFGSAVDLAGDVAIVGANRAVIEGDVDRGAAYVFEYNGGSWVEQQNLFDPKSGAGDNIGNIIDLDGDTVVVGNSIYSSKAGTNAGAVYVFVKEGAAWTQQQMLLASDAGPIDRFGSSVSLDRETLLVGAEQKMIGAAWRQGAAYVFTRSSDVWTEQQRLTASNGHQDSHLGIAVALEGGLALVGAKLDTNGQNNQGVVYEYRLQDGVWEEIQWFKEPQGQGLDSFGEGIVLDGERAIAGNSDNVVVTPQGAAWIFLRPILFADGFEVRRRLRLVDCGALGESKR